MNSVILDKVNDQTVEQRLRLHGVTWQQYEALVSIFIDQFPALRMTYLEGMLEIMTTSSEHERLKTLIARLLEIYFVEKRIPLNGYGGTTFRQQAAQRGLEPDECYCLGELQQVPDIAIEIVISSGGINKLEVYRGLAVKEVWFWQDNQFSLYQLIDGAYQAGDRSQFLPDLDLSLLAQYVGEANQTEAVIAFRDVIINQT